MKFAFLSVTYSGQFYQGPALTLLEQIRKARALGFDGLSIETKRPVASPLDLTSRGSAGHQVGRRGGRRRDLRDREHCRISPARSWRNGRTTWR